MKKFIVAYILIYILVGIIYFLIKGECESPSPSFGTPATVELRPEEPAAGGLKEIKPKVKLKISAGEAIDLGLSVKWASCNVGATEPWGLGGCYAWGEIKEKDAYNWDTYKHCNGSPNKITKYGNNDNRKKVKKWHLNPEDDVARATMRAPWRMPTAEEFTELNDKCVWTWVAVKGICGYLVTGPNGNTIFLPAAGSCYGSKKYNIGEDGGYWTSRFKGASACYLFIDKNYHGAEYSGRYNGFSVRPVCE